MDNGIEFEKEIDLMDLCYYILKRWRVIILVAVICSLLSGSIKIYRFAKTAHSQNTVQKADAASPEDEISYEKARQNLQQEISSLQNAIHNSEEYKRNSLLMNLDPYHVYESTADLYIKTDYAIYPDRVYQNPDYTASVVSSYTQLTLKGSVLESLSDELGLEPMYLKELIKITSESNTQMLHLKVIHPEKDICEKILNNLLEYLQSKKVEIERQIGPHAISILQKSSEELVRADIADMQKQEFTTYQNLQKSLKEKETALKHLEEPVEPQTLIKKSLIKFALLGFILGGALFSFTLCIRFLCSDSLISGDELKRLYKLKIFETSDSAFDSTSHTTKSKRGPGCRIDSIIDQLFRKKGMLTDEAIYELLAADIKKDSAHNAKLMLIGNARTDIKDQIAYGLKTRFPDGDLIIHAADAIDSETVKLLTDCSHVLLVEQCFSSTFTGISQELSIISNMKTQLLGCVLVRQ